MDSPSLVRTVLGCLRLIVTLQCYKIPSTLMHHCPRTDGLDFSKKGGN